MCVYYKNRHQKEKVQKIKMHFLLDIVLPTSSYLQLTNKALTVHFVMKKKWQTFNFSHFCSPYIEHVNMSSPFSKGIAYTIFSHMLTDKNVTLLGPAQQTPDFIQL